MSAPSDRVESESDPPEAEDRAVDDTAETTERPELPDDPALDTALTIEQPAVPDDPALDAAETIERPVVEDDPELDTAATGPLPSLAPRGEADDSDPIDEGDARDQSDEHDDIADGDGPIDALPLPRLSAPSVMVDGPSEARPSPTADRCPYCLTFIGLGAARRRGVRFCPLCGADWQTIGRAVQVPSGAVIPFDETDAPLPLGAGDDDDFPTSQYTRPETAPRPAVAAAPDEPPATSRPSPWLMLGLGVLAGLVGTLVVARWSDDPPTVEPTPTRAVERPVAPPPVAPAPVEPPPVEPAPVVPIEPPPVEPPDEPEPVEPLVANRAVQAVLVDTAALMPPSDMVDVRARVEGDIVFLDGRIGNTEALGRLVTAIARVEGVRAVDSRGVRPSSRVHTVAAGDTLAKIARLYYHDSTAWPTIYAANREVIDRPDQVVPGMRLLIPTRE